MPASRAHKEQMRGKTVPKGGDPLYSDKAAAKGKSTRQYKTQTVKDGAKPNYRQDGDGAKGTTDFLGKL